MTDQPKKIKKISTKTKLFNKKNVPFFILGFIIFVSFFLIFSLDNQQTNPSSSKKFKIPEIKTQIKLYNSKKQAYKERQEKQNSKFNTNLPFPNSLENQVIIPDNPKKEEVIKEKTPKISSKPIQPLLLKKTRRKLPASKKEAEELEKIKKEKKEKEKRRIAFLALHKEEEDQEIILAQINHNQIITNGKEICFHLLSELTIEGTTIAPYTLVYGKASFNTHRIEVQFSSIVYKNKLFPFERTLYDFDGFQGIAINSNEDLEQRDQKIKNEALGVDDSIDEIAKTRYLSKGIKTIKKIIKPKTKQISVEMISGHQVLLKKVKKL